MVEVDFAGVENLRRLYEQLGQEEEFKGYLARERGERIIKLAKLSKRFTLEESLSRMVGYCVI